MSYWVATGWGDSEDDPSIERMAELLGTTDSSDPEHGEIWLEHENGWSLSFSGARLVWEGTATTEPPMHMKGVSRERVLELWTRLVAGDLDAIRREPWQPGYGWEPPSAAELAERAASQLHADRVFYDQLGEERANTRCQRDDCARGAVFASVYCRAHHFEAVQKRACPFAH